MPMTNASLRSYKPYFLNAPVALLVQDFSQTYDLLAQLSLSDGQSLSAYLQAHPQRRSRLIGSITTKLCNQAARQMLGNGDITYLDDASNDAALNNLLTQLHHDALSDVARIQLQINADVVHTVNLRFSQSPDAARLYQDVIVAVEQATPSSAPLADAHSAFDNIPNYIYIYDFEEKRNVYANDAYLLQMLGYTGADWRNYDYQNIFDLIHPDDHAQITARASRLQAENSDQAYPLELRLRTANGDYHWMQDSIQVWQRNADGQPSRIIGSLINIHERVLAEQENQRQKELLEAVLNVLPNFIYIYDIQQDTLTFASNTRLPEVFGYQQQVITRNEEQDIGNLIPLRANIHPDDLPALDDAARRMNDNADGQIYITEYRFRAADGRYIWLQDHAQVWRRDENGKATHRIGSIVDINKRKQIEAQQHERENFINNVLNTVPNFVYIYDVTLNANVYANSGLSHVLGYTPQELQAMGDPVMTMLVHPDDLDALHAGVQRLLDDTDDALYEMEYRLKHKDGNYRWVYDRARVYQRDDKQRTKQIIGSVIDITSTRRVQEQLAASEERLKLATEHFPGAFIIYDADLRIQYANMIANEAGEVSPEDYLGKRPDEIFAPDKLEPYYRLTQKARQTKEAQRLEVQDNVFGQDVWVIVQAFPILDQAGNVQQIVNITLDITQRILAEIALEQTALRLSIIREIDQAILAQQPLSSIIKAAIDYIETLLPVQAAHVIRFDFDAKQITLIGGKPVEITGTVLPMNKLFSYQDKLAAGEAHIRMDIPSSSPKSVAEEFLLAQGVENFIMLPMLYRDDLIGGLTVGFNGESAPIERETEMLSSIANALAIAVRQHELSTQVEAHTQQLENLVEQRTRQLRVMAENLQESQRLLRIELEKAQEVSEMKSRFIAMATHEFKTPLAKAQLAADTLRRNYNKMTQEQRTRFLGRLTSSVEEINALLDDMLLVGNQQEEMRFQPEVITLGPFIHETVDTFKTVHRIPHEIVIIMDADAEARRFHVDPRLIQTILNNLVSNACKYSPEDSTVTITLDFNDKDKDNKAARITVADEGIGIPKADQADLFTTFHRASNVGSIGGTGLGLSIVKLAVERHSGDITFHSEEGSGTVFTITLPDTHLKRVR